MEVESGTEGGKMKMDRKRGESEWELRGAGGKREDGVGSIQHHMSYDAVVSM